jgi:hypothetical protein
MKNIIIFVKCLISDFIIKKKNSILGLGEISVSGIKAMPSLQFKVLRSLSDEPQVSRSAGVNKIV